MNIFKREMRAHLKSLLLWCVGMVFLIVAGMGKFTGFQSVNQSTGDLIAGMPRAFKIIFGIYDFDVSKIGGYYAMMFAYVLLMVTIHAAMLGANIISKEEREKTSEFLYVKPVSRTTIVGAKLAAVLTNMVILNIVSCISSIAIVSTFKGGEDITGMISRMMIYMFALQMVFASLGMVTAAYTRNPKTAASKSAAILLITYVLARVIEFNENLDLLKYLTPFKYFDTKALMDNVAISPVFYILCVGLIIVPFVLTFLHYNTKDLSI